MTNITDISHRSAEQVTERLDRLISKIRDVQGPYMDGEKPADVVLVCYTDMCTALECC